jgi:AcrR family transcriptional regulator
LPREERRRRTEAAILKAARELFAEVGFERTTIRSVAAKAGIDPALVMQYYGNKEHLFAEASRALFADMCTANTPRENLPDVALLDMFRRFEAAEDREAAVALMRNCLTHPSALESMRDGVMRERATAIAGKLDGADVHLRAALFGAVMMGLAMSRYLLEVEPIASASRGDIERLMTPVLRSLVAQTQPPAA